MNLCALLDFWGSNFLLFSLSRLRMKMLKGVAGHFRSRVLVLDKNRGKNANISLITACMLS